MNPRTETELTNRGWIGVDLDGTLAKHEVGKYDPRVVGEPIAPMVERVRRWLAEGRQVKIFTARVSSDGTAERERERFDSLVAVERWCLEQFGVVLEVTCTKDYRMLELWDDRAVQVEFNTGRVVGYSTRGTCSNT